MPLRTLLLSLAASALGLGCSSSEVAVVPLVPGLAVAPSDASVDVSTARLVEALEAAPPVGIVAQVDHAANASTAGLALRPTRVVLFGNPALGTPLMQINQRAGLDLPQRLLVYEEADGSVRVATPTPAYLAARHGLGDAPELNQIGQALDRFTAVATGADAPASLESAATVARDEGIVTVASANDLEATYGRLKSAIEGNPNLRLVAELDHQANAARVGLDLRPTRLLVFGNPSLGTPLMQARQTVAVDLPQKMLVYEDAAGDVFVAYNDPRALGARHRLGTLEAIETIRGALAGLAEAATSGG